jgi:hypothetical protein
MKTIVGMLGLSLLLIPCCATAGTIWYVDGAVSASGTGDSWERAFKTIQEGIDAASDGERVLVAEGTYVENILFNGKNITLTGTDPLDPNVVAKTVIDGNKAGRVVTFPGTEGEACALSGFTIRNGRADVGGGICSALIEWEIPTYATIENNIISENFAEFSGGGLALCDGTIQKNKITGNSGYFCGGGLSCCHGTIQSNIITHNSVSWHGEFLVGTGGGVNYCDGAILNNVIAGNSAQYGGGLASCAGMILNDVIYANSGDDGSALWGCDGGILNCIVSGNQGGKQLSGCSVPAYSCTERWTDGGEGTIAHHPYFQDPSNGDFHLKSYSPCIDAGDPASPFAKEPEPNGGRIDMGAYGNTPEATSKSPDTDADGLPDDWEKEFFHNLGQGESDDPDRDYISNLDEYYRGYNPGMKNAVWYVDGALAVSGDGKTWEAAFKKIQEAIDAASDGETVIVRQGEYAENVHLEGKNIMLRSTDPSDSTVVAGTIIDGSRNGPVVTFAGTEDETCVLSGFTIQNGRASEGAGILGRSSYGDRTHAAIENNVITGNSASGVLLGVGGGIAWCDGVIRNNTISNNSAGHLGGGLYGCGGRIQDNKVTANVADYGGGGLSGCDGTIQDNAIAGNSTDGGGGGLDTCGGTIQKNDITANSAQTYGGGLSGCDGLIQGNTISENSAKYGGGLAGCSGTVQDNTVSSNAAAFFGGGLFACDGKVQNNIILANSASFGGGAAGGGGCVQNNLLTLNLAAKYGGALYACGATVQNNTVYGNTAQDRGGGLFQCYGAIRNCVIWGNAASESGDQIDLSNTPTFSCIEGWSGGGPGNTDRDPVFVDAAGGDFRLRESSPCVNTAASYYWFAWPQRDLDGNCRLAGGGVDMGCYERGSATDSDGDLVSDADEVVQGSDPFVQDTDGDSLPDGLEVLRGTDPKSTTPPGILRVPSETATIQKALCLAVSGEEIVVAPGSYCDNLHFCGTDVTLRSSDPSATLVVAATILDGQERGPVVSFATGESEKCVLSGFTIRNGRALHGGGICGGVLGNRTHATVRNNVIAGNSSVYGGGAGVAFCDGIIHNNTFSQNSSLNESTGGAEVAFGGGALCECDGIIRNNLIRGNRGGSGGGLIGCNGTIENNTITGNWASFQGAALAVCNAAVRNCIIWDNISPDGIQIYDPVPQVARTIPTYSCIQSWPGGGQGNISEDPQFRASGNWDNAGTPDDPGDDVWTPGDYHIQASSPCIDSGKNEPWMWQALDLEHNPRILSGRSSLTVDMGAYEYNGFIDKDPPYVNECDPLPNAVDVAIDARIVLHVRDDGNGVDKGTISMTVRGVQVSPSIEGTPVDYTLTYHPPSGFDYGETVTVTVDAADRSSPSNVMAPATYAFTIEAEPPQFSVEIRPAEGGFQLTWSSLANKTYSIFYSEDLVTWHTAIENFPSSGDTTTFWIDDGSLTGLPPSLAPRRFYRILENP